ncbi:MAG TPA: SRPBCC family protein [Anaerolineae bacterium]|nr:SRPBCC family protein [Anaerolineae bacterium]
MTSNDYRFLTHWQVESTIEEISAILSNALDLPRWWPSVYLDVQELEPGATDGTGRVISLVTKGWLPYTLRWQFRVTKINTPHGFELAAFGDLSGRGVWTFRQSGHIVEIDYLWEVTADKPLLRRLSWLFKPIFAANHHWAMQKGYESLLLELARRRAATPEARAAVPAPPPPTFTRWLPAKPSNK